MPERRDTSLRPADDPLWEPKPAYIDRPTPPPAALKEPQKEHPWYDRLIGLVVLLVVLVPLISLLSIVGYKRWGEGETPPFGREPRVTSVGNRAYIASEEGVWLLEGDVAFRVESAEPSEVYDPPTTQPAP